MSPREIIGSLAAEQLREPVKHGLDVVAVGSLAANWIELLSLNRISALLVMVWTVLRIVESAQAVRRNVRDARGK